ncbi:MAG TPA: hypothetical protein VFP68_25170 [Burkholderiaceae bacterium]|nr:hypothetical protein [Burkholderiaceae bacterium]
MADFLDFLWDDLATFLLDALSLAAGLSVDDMDAAGAAGVAGVAGVAWANTPVVKAAAITAATSFFMMCVSLREVFDVEHMLLASTVRPRWPLTRSRHKVATHATDEAARSDGAKL